MIGIPIPPGNSQYVTEGNSFHNGKFLCETGPTGSRFVGLGCGPKTLPRMKLPRE